MMEVLASPRKRNISFVPLKIFFLDVPASTIDSDVETNSVNYSTYFERIQDIFYTSATEDGLKSHLSITDRNLETFLTHNKSRSDVETFSVWINNEPGGKSKLADRVRYWLPLYPLRSRSTPSAKQCLAGLLDNLASSENSDTALQIAGRGRIELPHENSHTWPQEESTSPRIDFPEPSQHVRDGVEGNIPLERHQRTPSLPLLKPHLHDQRNNETKSDNASQVTMPPSRLRDLDTIYELAFSFLQCGQLENAETLFVRMDDLLSDTKQC